MCPDREEYKVIDTPLVYEEANKEAEVLWDVPEYLSQGFHSRYEINKNIKN